MADKDTQPKQRPLSPREEAMNAVAANRNADFEKETGIKIEASEAVVDPDIDPEHAAAEAERARLQAAADKNGDAVLNAVLDEDAAQTALQKQQDDAAAAREAEAARVAEQATQRAQTSAGIDPAAKMKLKVNGRDVEITGEEALRRLQKDVSADDRLAEASRKEAEAHRILREAQEQQHTLQREQAEAAERAKTKGGNPDGVVVDPAIAKEFTAALFKGDEEAAVTAFNKAVGNAVAAAKVDAGRGNATPVDPSAIAAQVRQQITIDSALEQSRKDYPDLYSDPDIEAVAAARLQRLVNEGKPFTTALEEVQTGFAEKFGWKKQGSGTTKPPPRSDRREEKLERKATLDPTPAGPNVKTGTSDEPQGNVHDAILEIAKSRGQSVVS